LANVSEIFLIECALGGVESSSSIGFPPRFSNSLLIPSVTLFFGIGRAPANIARASIFPINVLYLT
jgi:hypothetical protein